MTVRLSLYERHPVRLEPYTSFPQSLGVHSSGQENSIIWENGVEVYGNDGSGGGAKITDHDRMVFVSNSHYNFGAKIEGTIETTNPDEPIWVYDKEAVRWLKIQPIDENIIDSDEAGRIRRPSCEARVRTFNKVEDSYGEDQQTVDYFTVVPEDRFILVGGGELGISEGTVKVKTEKGTRTLREGDYYTECVYQGSGRPDLCQTVKAVVVDAIADV